MIEQIFSEIPQKCQPEPASDPVSIYFSIDDVKKTVQMSSSGCQVDNGRAVDDADCVCKTSAEFFLKVWNEGYKPGLKDFLSGAIKSNKPDVLQKFLAACRKG
jgi:putative sterol carrier protein